MFGLIPMPDATVDFDLVGAFRNLALLGKVKPGSAPGHADGWGIVAWRSGLPCYLGREPTNAFYDESFDLACSQGRQMGISSALIAHLRKASRGEKTRDNTHPFVHGEWAFAHNGTIRRLNLRRKTDSEWFFQSLMEEFQRCGGDIMTAIASQVEAVREVYEYTSMSFLLSNGTKLYAYRDCKSDQDYYTMFYTKTADSFVVAQERFFDGPWNELGNAKLLVVDSSAEPEIIDVS